MAWGVGGGGGGGGGGAVGGRVVIRRTAKLAVFSMTNKMSAPERTMFTKTKQLLMIS